VRGGRHAGLLEHLAAELNRDVRQAPGTELFREIPLEPVEPLPFTNLSKCSVKRRFIIDGPKAPGGSLQVKKGHIGVNDPFFLPWVGRNAFAGLGLPVPLILSQDGHPCSGFRI